MAIEQRRLYGCTYRSIVQDIAFTIDKELLAAKSGKISSMLKSKQHEELSYLLRDLESDQSTFELIQRFCHGFKVSISSENVAQVMCLAHYLEMTEKHSPDNLLNIALAYFEHRILPGWNESIRVIRICDACIFEGAVNLGLIDACSESIVLKAIVDPQLLGELVKSCNEAIEEADDYRPNARKRLFAPDWKSEDLTNLSLRLYKPIIAEMLRRRVPSEYIAASLCQYTKKWAFTCIARNQSQDCLISKKTSTSQTEVIEAVEYLLPRDRGLLPCTCLFEMLRFAIVLEASIECRNGLEGRIGKQLEKAKVKDLLIISQGYAKEMQYDIECLNRIVKHFYSSYNDSGLNGLIKVAELIEDFLAEIASDIDLKMETFTSLAEVAAAATAGTQRNTDGIYRAMDIYLEKHRYLTESEREDVCSVLDCQKLSQHACEHAVKNKLLPLKIVVQVLFVSQLKLRGTIIREKNQERRECSRSANGEEEVRSEMQKMGSKVSELKKECHNMRREIQNGYQNNKNKKVKTSVWSQMKRKLGCLSTNVHDCNSQDMKKKKKGVSKVISFMF